MHTTTTYLPFTPKGRTVGLVRVSVTRASGIRGTAIGADTLLRTGQIIRHDTKPLGSTALVATDLRIQWSIAWPTGIAAVLDEKAIITSWMETRAFHVWAERTYNVW